MHLKGPRVLDFQSSRAFQMKVESLSDPKDLLAERPEEQGQ